MNARLVQFQQFDLLRLLASTKNDAKRRSFVRLPLVLVEPTQIEFHLALVPCLELSCNDPAKPAHFMRLKQMLEPGFSCQLPGAVARCYRMPLRRILCCVVLSRMMMVSPSATFTTRPVMVAAWVGNITNMVLTAN